MAEFEPANHINHVNQVSLYLLNLIPWTFTYLLFLLFLLLSLIFVSSVTLFTGSRWQYPYKPYLRPLPAAHITSFFFVRTRKKVRSFSGSSSRMQFLASLHNLLNCEEHCTVVELSMFVLLAIPRNTRKQTAQIQFKPFTT